MTDFFTKHFPGIVSAQQVKPRCALVVLKYGAYEWLLQKAELPHVDAQRYENSFGKYLAKVYRDRWGNPERSHRKYPHYHGEVCVYESQYIKAMFMAWRYLYEDELERRKLDKELGK